MSDHEHHDHDHEHEHAATPAAPAPVADSGPPEVSVVVLAYNSERYMRGCLESLARSRGPRIEVLCIDNASKDRSHELAQKHRVTTVAVRSEENLGYSGGNNLGWRMAKAPIVVFINPDCYVQFDTLAKLIEPLRRDPRIALTGAKLLYPHTSTIQHAGGILHPNAMCEHHGFNLEDGPEWCGDADCDYVTGALIAIRREDLEALGGFDEDYRPAYYEETDWCWRLRKAERRIVCVRGAIGYHYESPGLVKNSARFVRTSYRSRIRFVIKNYSVGELLGTFLPFELKWFFGPFAKGFRLATLRSYAEGAAFALKCLVRFSRRAPVIDRQPPKAEVPSA